MQRFLVLLVVAFGFLGAACAPVGGSVGVRTAQVSVGIHVSSYPRLSRIPGYPVYYAPGLGWNYFFYDGLFWVLDDDRWYASSWYDGPWGLIDPFYVPLYVLRVPVRYYVRPPAYFAGWPRNAPPRWDERFGRDWSTRRNDWNQWDRRAAPRPAPLPDYQRQYSGERYPRTPEQQRSIQADRYRHEPRDSVTQQYWQQRGDVPRRRTESQGDASGSRTEPQPGVRGSQPPRSERVPPPAQQQERSPPRQPEAQPRDRQQENESSRGNQGRGRQDREDKDDNRGRR